MAAKDKDKSLLELAVELLQKKRKPQKILAIMAEVMEVKGYKGQMAKDHAAQFILDFMQSGIFVYCGDDCWDLKDRQSTAVLDKDGGDYEEIYYDDEDVIKNELNDEIYDENYISDDDDEEDDSEDEADEIAREFEDYSLDDDIHTVENNNVSSEEDETEAEDLTEEDFK